VPNEIDLADRNFDSQRADELQLADGTWRAIPGGGIRTRVDDGSAPGVVFLVAGADDQSLATLTAVDSRTGLTLWRTPVPAVRYDVEGVVLGDRLYVATQRVGSVGEDRVTAYDARTGAVAWTKAGLGPGIVATDGTVLLTAPVDSYGFSNTVQASALEDGRPLWRDDPRAAVFPRGTAQGNLMGFAALPTVGTIGAWRVDGSLAVLGWGEPTGRSR
jgi:outer membrane protein assembly factor BamB